MIGDTGATQNSTTAKSARSGSRKRDISRWNTSAAPRPAASAITTEATFHGTASHVSTPHERGIRREERPGVLGDVAVDP